MIAQLNFSSSLAERGLHPASPDGCEAFSPAPLFDANGGSHRGSRSPGLRHCHAAKLRGTSVVRVIQQSARPAGRIREPSSSTSQRSAVNDSCLDDAWFPSAPGISRVIVSRSRRSQFAAAQHVIADRYFAVRECSAHALVHAFIAAADDVTRSSAAVPAATRLIEAVGPRRKAE